MTTPRLGGLVPWDRELDALIDQIDALYAERRPTDTWTIQSARARQRWQLHAQAARHFAALNGWRWRPVGRFSLPMLVACRARPGRRDDRPWWLDLDADYYWTAPGAQGRPAALVAPNLRAPPGLPPDVGPALQLARDLYRVARPALAVLTLPRSWYFPISTTAFLVVPAEHLRRGAA